MKCKKTESEVVNCDQDCDHCPVTLDKGEGAVELRRGRDRTSVVKIGCFTLSTDRDHKGFYRGKQAMEKGRYRGWHFHLESTRHSPDQVMDRLNDYLTLKGALAYEPDVLAIGVVEATPKRVSSWRSADGKATEVLWISGRTGSLHIEANKTATFTRALLDKKTLLAIAKEENDAVSNRRCPPEVIDYRHCPYFGGDGCWKDGRARECVGPSKIHCQFCLTTAGLVKLAGCGYLLCPNHLKRILGDNGHPKVVVTDPKHGDIVGYGEGFVMTKYEPVKKDPLAGTSLGLCLDVLAGKPGAAAEQYRQFLESQKKDATHAPEQESPIAEKPASGAPSCQYLAPEEVEMIKTTQRLVREAEVEKNGAKEPARYQCPHAEVASREITGKNGEPTGVWMKYCNLCGVDLGEEVREED